MQVLKVRGPLLDTEQQAEAQGDVELELLRRSSSALTG
jgi:hypothetical protein